MPATNAVSILFANPSKEDENTTNFVVPSPEMRLIKIGLVFANVNRKTPKVQGKLFQLHLKKNVLEFTINALRNVQNMIINIS